MRQSENLQKEYNKCIAHPTPFHPVHQQYVRRIHLKPLLVAIVRGDLKEVDRICEKYPMVLLEKLEENDYIVTYSGQKTGSKTPYQMALAERDLQMSRLLKAKLIKYSWRRCGESTIQ